MLQERITILVQVIKHAQNHEVVDGFMHTCTEDKNHVEAIVKTVAFNSESSGVLIAEIPLAVEAVRLMKFRHNNPS